MPKRKTTAPKASAMIMTSIAIANERMPQLTIDFLEVSLDVYQRLRRELEASSGERIKGFMIKEFLGLALKVDVSLPTGTIRIVHNNCAKCPLKLMGACDGG